MKDVIFDYSAIAIEYYIKEGNIVVKRNVFERNKLKTGIFKQHVVNDTPIHLQIIETTL